MLLDSSESINSVLVILKIGSVQSLESRDPNRKLCSKHFVIALTAENWITGVFHQIEMLKLGELGCYLLHGVDFIAELVVSHRENFQVFQGWQGIQGLHVVVVKDQLLKGREEFQEF